MSQLFRHNPLPTYDAASRIMATDVSSAIPGVSETTTQVYNGLGALASLHGLPFDSATFSRIQRCAILRHNDLDGLSPGHRSH